MFPITNLGSDDTSKGPPALFIRLQQFHLVTPCSTFLPSCGYACFIELLQLEGTL